MVALSGLRAIFAARQARTDAWEAGTMKPLIMLSLTLLCTLTPALAETHVPGGPVSGVWAVSGSPYLVDGDISVALGEQLLIEAGCWIEFTGLYEVRVFGRLEAQGTETDNITFTATNPSVGHQGLRFINTTTNGQEPSLLENCLFTNGPGRRVRRRGQGWGRHLLHEFGGCARDPVRLPGQLRRR